MAAFLSGDKTMIEDINNDVDFHSVNAIKAFDLDIEVEPYATLKKRVSKEHDYERTLAKIATFSSLYSGTAGAIAIQAGIPLNIAQSIIDALYSRYPGLGEWQERTRHDALTHSSVTTPWGRTRRFVFGRGMSRQAEGDQLRAAINFPIQAHSSDMNLLAFVNCFSRGIEVFFPFHDAIYAQAKEDEVDTVKRIIKQEMEAVIKGPLVFQADVKSGSNWMELG